MGDLGYIRLLATAAEGNYPGLVLETGTVSSNWVRLKLVLLDPATFLPMEVSLHIAKDGTSAVYHDDGWCTKHRAVYINDVKDHDLLFRLLADQYGIEFKDDVATSANLASLVLLMAQCTTIGRVTDY